MSLAIGSEESVVSHQSALALLDRSDVIPSGIHVTVPRRRRGYRADPLAPLTLPRFCGNQPRY
jgi:predicted transcriptional regulator of viral defense system